MPTPRPSPLALEATALRYAARDLPPRETAEFEARLAGEQAAREALAEAVRLSAAALGQSPLHPDSSFRALIRERLQPLRYWFNAWLSRRAYRGHPMYWTALGGGLVAAVLLALQESSTPPSNGGDGLVQDTSANPLPPRTDPARREPAVPEQIPADSHDDSARKAAEIWAELSTPDHIEKTHEDDAKLHHRIKNLHLTTHGPASPRPPSSDQPE